MRFDLIVGDLPSYDERKIDIKEAYIKFSEVATEMCDGKVLIMLPSHKVSGVENKELRKFLIKTGNIQRICD